MILLSRKLNEFAKKIVPPHVEDILKGLEVQSSFELESVVVRESFDVYSRTLLTGANPKISFSGGLLKIQSKNGANEIAYKRANEIEISDLPPTKGYMITFRFGKVSVDLVFSTHEDIEKLLGEAFKDR